MQSDVYSDLFWRRFERSCPGLQLWTYVLPLMLLMFMP